MLVGSIAIAPLLKSLPYKEDVKYMLLAIVSSCNILYS